MNRRETLLALLAAGIAPFGVEAQQPTKRVRIAYLGFATPEVHNPPLNAFKQRLGELGYLEGKNVVYEYRWAEGKTERLPGLAEELVALNPDAIFVSSTPTALAAQKATTTIPIVMTSITDPVGKGIVKSLAHPGGNITGFSTRGEEAAPKLLDLLLTVAPKRSHVAVFHSMTHAADLMILDAVAKKASVRLSPIAVRAAAEFEDGFARCARENVGAIIVLSEALFFQHKRQVTELALRHRFPSIFMSGDYPEAGGLMSYGQSVTDAFRDAAGYVDRVLKGTRPGELPVQQLSKFELIINLNTAKVLGIKIPQSVLVRADRVIE